MALNDRLKGSFYPNYTNKLASKSDIKNYISTLSNFYNDLVYLTNNTFNKIDKDRETMLYNINKINIILDHIQYMLDTFNSNIDNQLDEKLQLLIKNFNYNVGNIIEQYHTNLNNHRFLLGKDKNDEYIHQTYPEYERSIKQLQNNLGIRWYGGKLNDRNLLNNLNGMFRLLKHNGTNGLLNDTYNNSNLIFELFIYIPNSGLSWIEFAQNGALGYNINVKYHSKNNNFKSILKNNAMFTGANYEINNYDMDMLINLGLSDDQIKNGNIYIKVKTNLPTNELDGMDSYYLVADGNSTNKSKINTINDGLVLKNNPDFKFNGKLENDPYKLFSNADEAIDIDSEIKINNITEADLNDTRFNLKDYGFSTGVEFKIMNNKTFINNIKGNNNEEYENIQDMVGPVFTNSKYSSDLNMESNILDDFKFNTRKYVNGDRPQYNRNEQVIDRCDIYKPITAELDPRNELSFNIEDIDKKVLDNQDFKVNETIYNVNGQNLQYMIDKLIVIDGFPEIRDVENRLIVYKTNYGIISLTDMGIRKLTINENKIKSEECTINNIDGLNNLIFIKMIELNDGTLYAISNHGIFKSVGKDVNNLPIFDRTNIVSGNFMDICKSGDGNSFYAIKSGGNKIQLNKDEYRLDNTFYKLTASGNIRAYEDLIDNEFNGEVRNTIKFDNKYTDGILIGTDNGLKYSIDCISFNDCKYSKVSEDGEVTELTPTQIGRIINIIEYKSEDYDNKIIIAQSENYFIYSEDYINWKVVKNSPIDNKWKMKLLMHVPYVYCVERTNMDSEDNLGIGYLKLDIITKEIVYTSCEITREDTDITNEIKVIDDIILTEHVSFPEGFNITFTTENCSNVYLVVLTPDVMFHKFTEFKNSIDIYEDDEIERKLYYMNSELSIITNKYVYNGYIELDNNNIVFIKLENIEFTTMPKYYYDNDKNLHMLYSKTDGLYYTEDIHKWIKVRDIEGFDNINYIPKIDKFIGSGNNIGLYYSSDGMDWTQTNITNGNYFITSIDEKDIIFAHNNDETSNTNGIVYSTDGINWNLTNINEGKHNIYYFSKLNKFYACRIDAEDIIKYSNDGATWFDTNSNSGNYELYYNESVNYLFALSNNSGFVSEDGIVFNESEIQGYTNTVIENRIHNNSELNLDNFVDRIINADCSIFTLYNKNDDKIYFQIDTHPRYFNSDTPWNEFPRNLIRIVLSGESGKGLSKLNPITWCPEVITDALFFDKYGTLCSKYKNNFYVQDILNDSYFLNSRKPVNNIYGKIIDNTDDKKMLEDEMYYSFKDTSYGVPIKFRNQLQERIISKYNKDPEINSVIYVLKDICIIDDYIFNYYDPYEYNATGTMYNCVAFNNKSNISVNNDTSIIC